MAAALWEKVVAAKRREMAVKVMNRKASANINWVVKARMSNLNTPAILDNVQRRADGRHGGQKGRCCDKAAKQNHEGVNKTGTGR